MSKERFEELLKEMSEIHKKKNRDYAGDEYLSNLRMCERMGVAAWRGVVVRLTDKMARLIILARPETTATNESVRDTFLDTAIYSLMGLIAYEDSVEGTVAPDAGIRRSHRPTQRRRKKAVSQPSELPPEGEGTVQTI